MPPPNTLPTLGAPMPPAAPGSMPATNMGQILAQLQEGQRQRELADSLLNSGYVKNSGAMGAIAQMFSAHRGNKLNRRANETIAEALQRKFDEEGKAAAAADPLNVRTRYLGQVGLDPKSPEGQHYLLTGDLPAARQQGPMNVGPGSAVIDPATGRVIYQAPFAPREAPQVSLQSVEVPDGQGGSRRMNFNPRTGQYSDPFDGAGAGFGSKPPPKAVTDGKPLPGNIVSKLTKAAETADNTSSLLSTFNDEFAGNTITGGLENTLGRWGGESIGVASPGQADWWQQYDRQKNQVRNELFGSALTPSEQAAFEQADINPRMDGARIRANLAMQETIIRKGLERQAKTWKANGYNVDAIDAATAPEPPASSGQAQQQGGQSNGQDFSRLWRAR